MHAVEAIRFVFAVVIILSAKSFAAFGADSGERTVVIEAFVRKSSSSCDAARTYLDGLQSRREGLMVVYRDLSLPDAQRRLDLIAGHFKIQQPETPTFYLGRRVASGFSGADTTGADIERLLTVEVFVRAGCAHCAAAKEFLRTVEPRYPALQFIYRDIISDGSARKRWENVCRDAGVTAPGIPTVHAFGQVIVGFETAATTGVKIDSLLRSATIASPMKRPQRSETSQLAPGHSGRRTARSGRPHATPLRQSRNVRADSPPAESPGPEVGGPPPPMADFATKMHFAPL